MKRTSLIYGLLLLAAACKENETIAPLPPITLPVISSVSKTFVQAGDTIVIKGEHLLQDTLVTNLAISGRPARILKLSADSVQAIIPQGTYPGKILLTISRGNAFASVYGPELNVLPIAGISGYTPAYLFGGDTVTLFVRDFSKQDADNYISVNGKPLKLVYNNGKDTIRGVVPADATMGTLSWKTYGGQLHSADQTLYIRQKSYNAANIMEWLAQDPAFRFQYFAMNMPEVQGRFEYTYIAPYLNGTKTCAIFLPEDNFFISQGITTTALYKERIVNPRQWIPTNTLLASCLPAFGGSVPLQEGTHETALDRVISTGVSPNVINKVEIIKEGDDFYIQALAYWGLMEVRLKATFLGQAGGSNIYQVGQPLPYDNEYF